MIDLMEENILKAVILAAGEGKRLRPFTVSRPKVMIPVAGKPILEYVVEALLENGITDIVMVVGYHKEKIMSYFEDGKRYGAKISYAVQEKQLGTGHALLCSREYLDEDFLVVAGDNLIDSKTISDLLMGQPPAMLVTRSETPSKYGVIQVRKGQILSIVEKPEEEMGNIINTGIYWFTEDFLEKFANLRAQGDLGITDMLQQLLPDIELKAIPTDGRWIDAVYPWDLIALNAAALRGNFQQLSGNMEPGVVVQGSVKIGKGTRIRTGTYIQGPVSIGEGCEIGPSVVIYPSTSIGNGVQIDPFTFIRESLIMDNVRIGSHCHISRSVLDDGVKLGSGCVASSGQAYICIEEEFFKLDELGALIGEHTSIGDGVIVRPGTVIGAGCRIGSHTRISENLEDRSVVC